MVKILKNSYLCKENFKHVKIYFNPNPKCSCQIKLTEEDLTILFLSFSWKLSSYRIKSYHIDDL